MKTPLIAIYHEWSKLDTLAFLAIIFYIVYTILGVLNTPVGTDEAKYYLVASEVYAGRVPWVDVHPGPAGNIFYILHMMWMAVAGVGYESGRMLGVLLTLISVVAVYTFLRLYVNRYYLPLIWLFLYIFNPYVIFYGFLISHHSISNAFMLIAVVSALALWKQCQRVTGVKVIPVYIIVLALLCGTALGIMVSVRIHMFLLILVVAMFFFIMLPKYIFCRILPVYVFGFLSVVIFNHVFFEFVVTDYPVETIGSSVDIENTALRNVRTADAKEILVDLNIFSRLTNLEILQPLAKTLFGYSASSLFLMNIVLSVIAIMMLRNVQRDDKVFVWFFICAGAMVFFPMFLLRYSLSPSSSYFYQSYFFLSMLALWGILSLARQYAAYAINDNRAVLIALFVLLVMQNFIFGKPHYWYENPTYAIYKRLGYVENDYASSLYNIKSVATLINTMTTPDDTVLVGNHGITPYLHANHVIGTEMNMSRDFFSNYAVSLALENNLKSTPMGTNALEVDRMLLEGEIQYIVDRGFIHDDLFLRMKNLFCLEVEKFGYRIYAKCSKG